MIDLPKEELTEALKGFRLLKRKKGASKTPLAVQVERTEERIRLSALRLDHAMSYVLPVSGRSIPVKPFGLNADHLEGAVKAADRKSVIRIDPEGKVVLYLTKGVEIERAFYATADEPVPETGPEEGTDVPLSEEVMATVAEATVCASTDESRYLLNGVYLAPGEIAATNGRKLYLRKTPALPLPEDGVILPLHPALKVFVSGGSALFRLGPKPEKEGLDRRFRLTAGPWSWSAFLVNGRYPNYRQVLPREDESRIRIALAEEDALKLVEILPNLPGAKESDAPVTLEVREREVAVVAEAEGTSNRIVLEATRAPAGTPETAVRFNRWFFRESLQLGFRTAAVKDELNCVVMEDRERSRTFLWMPLRPSVAERETSVAATRAAPARTPETASAAPAPESEPEPTPPNRLRPETADTPVPYRNERNQPTMQRTDHDPNGRETIPANRLNRNGTNGNGAHGSHHAHGTNGAHGSNGSNGTNGDREEMPADPLARAREGIGRLRETLRELNAVLQEVNASLREAERDHKALEREHRGLRKNLRGLQALDV